MAGVAVSSLSSSTNTAEWRYKMRRATYSDMLQAYSDAFKAYHGVRPMYARFTYEELGEEILRLERWADEEHQAAIEAHGAAILAVLDAGAPDTATAERWLDEAMYPEEYV
tara:strand:- start:1820 stop:2152 length:333 start_codon:yes stop_codon:yes gene_type:complete